MLFRSLLVQPPLPLTLGFCYCFRAFALQLPVFFPVLFRIFPATAPISACVSDFRLCIFALRLPVLFPIFYVAASGFVCVSDFALRAFALRMLPLGRMLPRTGTWQY